MSFEVNFDGGYAPNCLQILFDVYLFEHDSPQEGKKFGGIHRIQLSRGIWEVQGVSPQTRKENAEHPPEVF